MKTADSQQKLLSIQLISFYTYRELSQAHNVLYELCQLCRSHQPFELTHRDTCLAPGHVSTWFLQIKHSNNTSKPTANIYWYSIIIMIAKSTFINGANLALRCKMPLKRPARCTLIDLLDTNVSTSFEFIKQVLNTQHYLGIMHTSVRKNMLKVWVHIIYQKKFLDFYGWRPLTH